MFDINGLAGHIQFPPFKMTDDAMQKMRGRLHYFLAQLLSFVS